MAKAPFTHSGELVSETECKPPVKKSALCPGRHVPAHKPAGRSGQLWAENPERKASIPAPTGFTCLGKVPWEFHAGVS